MKGALEQHHVADFEARQFKVYHHCNVGVHLSWLLLFVQVLLEAI